MYRKRFVSVFSLILIFIQLIFLHICYGITDNYLMMTRMKLNSTFLKINIPISFLCNIAIYETRYPKKY